MIYDQIMFAHSRLVKNGTVELPNGSMTQVIHIGIIVLSTDLILDNVCAFHTSI